MASTSEELPVVLTSSSSIAHLFERIFKHKDFEWKLDGIETQSKEYRIQLPNSDKSIPNILFLTSRLNQLHQSQLLAKSPTPVAIATTKPPEVIGTNAIFTSVRVSTLQGIWFFLLCMDSKDNYVTSSNYLISSFPADFNILEHFNMSPPEGLPIHATPDLLYIILVGKFFKFSFPPVPDYDYIYLRQDSLMVSQMDMFLKNPENGMVDMHQRIFDERNLRQINGVYYLRVNLLNVLYTVLSPYMELFGTDWGINKDIFI